MRKTKWIPLKGYISAGTSRLIMARRNKKTGMIYFRVKLIAGISNYCRDTPTLDMDNQFELLMKED